MGIPSEFVKAAETAYAKPSIRINRRLGDRWKPGPGDVILEKVLNFLIANAVSVGDIPFALRLHQEAKPAGVALSTAQLTSSTAGKLTLHELDENLSVFASETLEIDDTDPNGAYLLQELSSDSPILHYVNRGFARIFAGGGLIHEFNPSTGGPVGTTHHFKRRAADYEVMITEHYEHCVKHAQRCKHWNDRPKRILHAKTFEASKTEFIFQTSLEQWLRDYIADGAEVRVELRAESADRTDIEIYPLFGGYFIIEIKWMGSNGTTKYGEERITKGMKQIKTYLSTGHRARRATLVAYDGRDEANFESLKDGEEIAEGIKRINKDVPPRGSCYVLFLFNKQASNA